MPLIVEKKILDENAEPVDKTFGFIVVLKLRDSLKSSNELLEHLKSKKFTK